MTAGFDAEPWAVELVDQRLVAEEISSSLVTVTPNIEQEYLWVNDPHADHEYGNSYDDPRSRTSLGWYNGGSNPKHPGSTFFATSLPNGTETGVLREHALRLSSEIHCKDITRSEFPSSCAGERPINMEINTSGVALRVCVPGDFKKQPWSRTRNREDIEEELYLDLQLSEGFGSSTMHSFTMHCTASSTRGYFELGNVMNNQTYGEILDKWPDPETIMNEYNDYSNETFNDARPGEMYDSVLPCNIGWVMR